MKLTLAKISLLTFLGFGSIGTVLAGSGIPCPTVAGMLTKVAQEPDGMWLAERAAARELASSSMWQTLIVAINDKDVTNADEALKRGNKILDSSWWGDPEAIQHTDKNGNIYFTCTYEVDKPFIELNDQLVLLSFTFLGNGTLVNSKTSLKRMENKTDIRNIFNKAKR